MWAQEEGIKFKPDLRPWIGANSTLPVSKARTRGGSVYPVLETFLLTMAWIVSPVGGSFSGVGAGPASKGCVRFELPQLVLWLSSLAYRIIASLVRPSCTTGMPRTPRSET